ncbi:AraC family transcriptional regulator ligand-binding domain-containing protein, partial [Glaciimonas sp. GG7]
AVGDSFSKRPVHRARIDPGLLSRRVPVGAMKYALMAMMSAPTIGAAIYRYSRFSRLINDDYELRLTRGSIFCTLTVEEYGTTRRFNPMAIEFNLKVFHGLASWLIGRNLPLVRVDFTAPKPHYLDDLSLLFPCKLYFDQTKAQMVFEAALLDIKVQRNEPEMRSFLAHQPRDWLHPAVSAHPARSEVWQYLLDTNPSTPTLAEVACALRVSVRTMARRLANEGQTFQEIKDDLRRDIAIDRLAHSKDTVAQIAHDLGFEDPSSFYRAFRLWTGVTPRAYRSVAEE